MSISIRILKIRSTYSPWDEAILKLGYKTRTWARNSVLSTVIQKHFQILLALVLALILAATHSSLVKHILEAD